MIVAERLLHRGPGPVLTPQAFVRVDEKEEGGERRWQEASRVSSVQGEVVERPRRQSLLSFQAQEVEEGEEEASLWQEEEEEATTERCMYPVRQQEEGGEVEYSALLVMLVMLALICLHAKKKEEEEERREGRTTKERKTCGRRKERKREKKRKRQRKGKSTDVTGCAVPYTPGAHLCCFYMPLYAYGVSALASSPRGSSKADVLIFFPVCGGREGGKEA